MKGSNKIRTLATVACLVALTYAPVGCKSNPTGTGAAKAPAPDPSTLGSVSGVVRLAGNAPVPVRIDTTMDPACSPSGGDTYSEQLVVHDGKLANVFVYIKSGPPAAMLAGESFPPLAVLDQKGCSYVPHVIAVEAAGSVEFRNDDMTMHNVHAMPTVVGNAAVDISEGPNGKPQTRQFKQPEIMIPVRCNNHPWMSAFINVSATPWFAVTGADGSFTLKGMPAGQYVLGFVQEKLGEQDLTVTVKPHSVTTADESFTMKPEA
jgi:plastocyanin